MGDLVKVHEMYIEGDLCWGDGAGGVWATRSLAEDSHRLWVAEADRQTAAEEAARKNAEAMTPTDDEQRDAETESRNAEIRAANAARNAGSHARDEMLAAEQLNAEILLAHRAAPTVKKVEYLAGPSEWDDGYGRRWCSENAANAANAERRKAEAVTFSVAADAARKADKPGDWEGHPTPPMLEDATSTAARKKRDADLVQDAIELHDKIGRILHPLSGKSQKFHEAYSTFALALLDLHDEVK